MLRRIDIRDFSLLRGVCIELGPGLTVITGESGAGKTLVLDAVAFALGGRPNRSLLAEGATSCEVSLLLELSPGQAAGLGQPWRSGSNILARRLSSSGRSTFSLNGAPVGQGQVLPAAQQLVEITGQFESRVLYNPREHLGLLDAFGEAKLAGLRDKYQESYARWRELKAQLAALAAGVANRAQEIDFLRFQTDELEKAKVEEGEHALVEGALRVQQHAQALLQSAAGAAALLAGEDTAEGAYDLVARAAAQVGDLDHVLGGQESGYPGIAGLKDGVEEALELLRDLGARCAAIAGSIQHDPAEEERLRERLDELIRLERKYGCSGDELPALLEEKQARLALLTDESASPDSLSREIATALAEVRTLGGQLSVQRRKAAKLLVDKATRYFRQLDFPYVELHVEQAELADPGSDGLDEVELFVSLNPGEPARPLAQVASGGEASRLLLGIKAALAGHLGFDLLMLDEIEAGLGGDTALHVAEVLAELAAERQVVAITHLPVVAAQGKVHLAAVKRVVKGRTSVEIAVLDDAGRRAELGRMLGGSGAPEEQALVGRLLGDPAKARRAKT